ncbi:MAG: histidine phosphatase family protein [Candidatus Hydrogenedentes bacterium]|nr:histidine phosphatase family protein [Candidatus Hydrogenedentota bacterium]
MDLLIIRHAQSTFNTGNFDQVDGGLTGLGRRQAKLLGNRLQPDPPECLFVSPMTRTIETAVVALQQVVGLRAVLWPLLHERIGGDMSRYVGRPVSDLLRTYPDFTWMDESPAERWWPVADERAEDVVARARAVLDTLSRLSAVRRVALITHNVFAQRLLEEITPEASGCLASHRFTPGAITHAIMREGRRGAVVHMDDDSHLLNLDALMTEI